MHSESSVSISVKEHKGSLGSQVQGSAKGVIEFFVVMVVLEMEIEGVH